MDRKNLKLDEEKLKEVSDILNQITQEISKVLVGQSDLILKMIVCLLSKGHLLIEGVPGLAKTTAVKTLAGALDLTFSRISFTPDLLPSDITGSMILDPVNMSMRVRYGPIFANLILADEINRAPAKVQSALLEAMQERQVTIGNETYMLPQPFMVVATENPIEHEGTYPLPEAQLDRFMMKVIIDYPNDEEEIQIIERFTAEIIPTVTKVISKEEINHLIALIPYVYVAPRINSYILGIVRSTRYPGEVDKELAGYIEYGASPRASIYLNIASRAVALCRGRNYVIPDDVKDIAFDILRHRIILSYEAEVNNISTDNFIARILSSVKVP